MSELELSEENPRTPPLYSPSAINSSWICFSYPERGWLNETCFFLYFQQLNRKTAVYGHIEAVILTLICVSSLPFNALALFNFHTKRKMNPSFSILTAIFAISNISISAVGLVIAVCRITDSWYFGDFGCSSCFFIFFGGMFMMSWTKVLISFERLFNARSDGDLQEGISISVGTTTALLLIMLTIDVLIWSYPMITLELAHVMPVFPKENQTTIEVCTLFPYRIPNGDYAFTFFTFGSLFCFPIFITSVNIWKLWILANQLPTHVHATRRGTLSALFFPEAFQPRPNGTFKRSASEINASRAESDQNNRFRMYVRLKQKHEDKKQARLMAMSLGFFTCSNLPFHVVLGYIAANSHVEPTVESSKFLSTMYLMLTNCAVNLLIQSFGSKVEAATRRFSTHESFIKITADVKPSISANTIGEIDGH